MYLSELVARPGFVECPDLPPAAYGAEAIARDPARRVWFYDGVVAAGARIPSAARRVYGAAPVVLDASGVPVTLTGAGTAAVATKGDPGKDGKDGTNGKDGKDGNTPTMPRSKRLDVTTGASGQVALVFGFDPPLAQPPDVILVPFATAGGANLSPSIVDGTLTATGCTVQVTRPKALLALTALSGLTASVASGTAMEGVVGAKVRAIVEERLS